MCAGTSRAEHMLVALHFCVSLPRREPLRGHKRAPRAIRAVQPALVNCLRVQRKRVAGPREGGKGENPRTAALPIVTPPSASPLLPQPLEQASAPHAAPWPRLLREVV